MKKITAILLALVFTLTPCSATGHETQATAASDSVFQNAIKDIRQRYISLGYKEVQYPSTETEVCAQLGVNSELRDLAYMDIESASSDMRKKILEARQEIIYMADGWHLGDENVYIVWFDSINRVWGELPSFNELFPGWDVPTNQNDLVAYDFGPPTDWFSNDRVKLNKASATEAAKPYARWTFQRDMYTFYMEIKKLETSEHCNLGITNLSVTPNQDLGFKKHLVVGEGLAGAINKLPITIGLRASTDSVPGYATIFSECNMVD